MFRPGDQIGPYTLVSKLGKGAFGVVWLAERRTQITTTSVAIKIPLDDDISIETIKNEADVWVRASGHPNVLPIIEADIYGDHIVIASEYAPDGSLDAWLKRNGKAPSVESAVEIVSGILAGLEHLHSRNIIHRDLKPANILFQGTTPRLADFGISRVLKSTSQSSNVMGTPLYMAPEAFDGKRNERTDIWSVGVIFYQLLTGRLPFDQADMTSLLGAILTRNPEPLPSTVPVGLQTIVFRTLAKNPRDRYKSAAEVRAALRDMHETKVDKSRYTENYRKESLQPPRPIDSQSPKRPNYLHNIVYVIGGAFFLLIAASVIILLLKQTITEGWATSQKSVNPSPVTSGPNCVVSYTSGSCWTINPSTITSCSNLDRQKSSVTISNDGSSATMIVPPDIVQGVGAENASGQKLFLKEGDWFEISAEGQVSFSGDHPCAGPEGVHGWYDPYVDSPFKQNVGGLEFSIDSLRSTRFFVSNYYKDRAQTSGVPVFRIIDRLTGYEDNHSGAFRIKVRKINN